MGCSAGSITSRLATMYPKSTIHGCDIDEDSIKKAQENYAQLKNLSFSVKDLCQDLSEWSGKFDLIVTFDVVHDLPFASRALSQIRQTLKPGGQFIMIDINAENSPARNPGSLYSVSLFHCMAQSLYYEGSEGLGTAWGKQKAQTMLQQAGYSNIREVKSSSPLFMIFVSVRVSKYIGNSMNCRRITLNQGERHLQDTPIFSTYESRNPFDKVPSYYVAFGLDVDRAT